MTRPHLSRMVITTEQIDRLGWRAFAYMDRVLRNRIGLLPGARIRWELAGSQYDARTDTWIVAFRCWP